MRIGEVEWKNGCSTVRANSSIPDQQYRRPAFPVGSVTVFQALTYHHVGVIILLALFRWLSVKPSMSSGNRAKKCKSLMTSTTAETCARRRRTTNRSEVTTPPNAGPIGNDGVFFFVPPRGRAHPATVPLFAYSRELEKRMCFLKEAVEELPDRAC